MFTQYEAGYKAAGVGNIETEHLVYAHPRLCVLLSLLFNCTVVHSWVPHRFGVDVVVPFLKGNNLDQTSADIYRGITLSPHVSKIFEMCFLEM